MTRKRRSSVPTTRVCDDCRQAYQGSETTHYCPSCRTCRQFRPATPDPTPGEIAYQKALLHARRVDDRGVLQGAHLPESIEMPADPEAVLRRLQTLDMESLR